MKIDDDTMPTLWDRHKAAFFEAVNEAGLADLTDCKEASWELIQKVCAHNEYLPTLFVGYLLGLRTEQPLCKHFTPCGICEGCKADGY